MGGKTRLVIHQDMTTILFELVRDGTRRKVMQGGGDEENACPCLRE